MDDWWNRAACRDQDPYLWDLDAASEATIRPACGTCNSSTGGKVRRR